MQSHTPHRFLDSFQITDGILAFAEAAAMYGGFAHDWTVGRMFWLRRQKFVGS